MKEGGDLFVWSSGMTINNNSLNREVGTIVKKENIIWNGLKERAERIGFGSLNALQMGERLRIIMVQYV